MCVHVIYVHVYMCIEPVEALRKSEAHFKIKHIM